MTSITDTIEPCKLDKSLEKEESYEELADELREMVLTSGREGSSIQEVEKAIWGRVLKLGYLALKLFVQQAGQGDLGEEIELPDGRQVRRLPRPHKRDFASVFGALEIWRFVYGTREGQKIEHVPLDSRLDLPAGKFSELLQEWSQLLAVDQSFSRTQRMLEIFLGLRIPIDSLERLCRNMSELVVDYWDSLEPPPPEEEGELLVETADFKGVPMIGAEPGASTQSGGLERPEGKKKMALLGGVYSVDRFQLTPKEVADALYREQEKKPASSQPKVQHKRLRASLERDEDGKTSPAVAEIFSWMALEAEVRNPGGTKEVVFITDGQLCLEEAAREHLDSERIPVFVLILDILHVTPRLWKAGKQLGIQKGRELSAFVRKRVERILRGEVDAVVIGLRSMATRRKLKGKKLKRLEAICGYYESNQHRMRYHEYLAAGYPIATGVIEGACRHIVKDRLERSGMRWIPQGAQAMLDLRTIDASGVWNGFQSYRRRKQTDCLYPFRGTCDTVQLRLVA